MKIFVFYLFLIGGLWACGAKVSPEKEAAKVLTPVDEDDLLTRLSMKLIPQPQTQAQKDQNDIVNYAIDQLLDLEMTPSGLFYQLTDQGQTQNQPLDKEKLLPVNYRGTFLDGRVFDQSELGKPLKIKFGQVIPGWQEALSMMGRGGKGLFILPSHLGYGSEGLGTKIPPNTILKFEIEWVALDQD